MLLYKKHRISYKRRFSVTLACFSFSSLAIVLIPFIQYLPEIGQKIATVFVAAVFWLGIILGLVSVKRTDSILKTVRLRLFFDEEAKLKKIPGIVYFTLKPIKALLYLFIIAGICLMVSDIIFHFIPEIIMFLIIALTFLAFVIHCIFDGYNYRAYETVKDGLNNDKN